MLNIKNYLINILQLLTCKRSSFITHYQFPVRPLNRTQNHILLWLGSAGRKTGFQAVCHHSEAWLSILTLLWGRLQEMWNHWHAEFFWQHEMFRLLGKKKKRNWWWNAWGTPYRKRKYCVWPIRKWVQSICFGSIFTCFGGISIANWKLALRVGITSLQKAKGRH